MKKFKVGIQLYGVRDKMREDMEATLKAVKEMGYDYVEFAGYFEKTSDEVRALLDKYGLESPSVHQAIKIFDETPVEAVEYLKAIGAKYCVIPSYPADELYDNWDATIERFKRVGTFLKENGITLMYHNHDFEFKTVDGEYILDRMYNTIPNDILQPEFDTCWIHYAGVEPGEYLKKYKGKIDIVHLKDFSCSKLGNGPVYDLIAEPGSVKKREDTDFRFEPIGCGIQDIKSILEASEYAGADYIVVEQDDTYERDTLEAARISREYLKKNFNI